MFIWCNPLEEKKASEGFDIIAEKSDSLSKNPFYLNGPKLSINTNQANIL